MFSTFGNMKDCFAGELYMFRFFPLQFDDQILVVQIIALNLQNNCFGLSLFHWTWVLRSYLIPHLSFKFSIENSVLWMMRNFSALNDSIKFVYGVSNLWHRIYGSSKKHDSEIFFFLMSTAALETTFVLVFDPLLLVQTVCGDFSAKHST